LEVYENETTQEPLVQPPKNQMGLAKLLIETIETILLAVLLFIGINAVSARIRVDGFSMLPTLQSHQYVLVNRLAYRLGSPQTGDVIVFHYPRDPEQEYIKRVIGLPGDRVQIASGEVMVNGMLIDEPYIADAPLYQTEWTVPENSLFVLGDNRNNSSDSHNWGPVPMEYVVGKAVLIYWPLENWGLIAGTETALK
jgi:signal peptidase I